MFNMLKTALPAARRYYIGATKQMHELRSNIHRLWHLHTSKYFFPRPLLARCYLQDVDGVLREKAHLLREGKERWQRSNFSNDTFENI